MRKAAHDRNCCLVALLAAPAAAQAKSTITLSGSTSVAPLATKLAKGYLKAKPGKAKFRMLQGGSDIGIADVSRGRVSLGMSSRDPQPSDPGGLVFNRIARDGVCVATHPTNPFANLSQDTVQAIFSGQRAQLEPGAGRQRVRRRSTWSCVTRPPVRRTPSRTSSWARTCASRRAPASGPRTGACSRRSPRTRTRSATSTSTSPKGTSHRALQGSGVHAAQREVGPVRRRS